MLALAPRRFLLLGLVVLSAACDGLILGGRPPPSPPAPPPVALQPAAALHRLTAVQFESSVHALLGAEAPLTAIEADTDLNGFATVAASHVALSPAGVERYELALGAATEFVFADDARVAAVLGCVPSAVSDPCVRPALERLGRRAFRRPLTEAESQRFVGLVADVGTEAGEVRVGLRAAVWAMLQSPSFLYRVELGRQQPDERGRHPYTSFEMASRLAAVLWASLPDDELLAAAQLDTLTTAAGVRAQAARLLADPRARRGFAAYLDDLYNTDHLAQAIKDATLFPSWTPALKGAMHEELRARTEALVFEHPGDFLSLYDASTSFVNDALATHYGLAPPGSGGFTSVTLPPSRRGLLGSGLVLASYALPQRSSPTQRGRFVAEVLLCKTVPDPPPNVVTTIDQSGDAGVTLREQLEAHRRNPQCAGCHALMDPIGLGLEAFDSVGQYRETDKGRPIDASGTLDGVAFRTGAELATVVRNHPNAGPCFVKQLYTFAQGRAVLPVDEAALAGLAQQFAASGHRADQALLDLVSSDAFRFVEPGKN